MHQLATILLALATQLTTPAPAPAPDGVMASSVPAPAPAPTTVMIEAPTLDQPETVTPQPVIQEDDPEWNCATQGNYICGWPNGQPMLPHPELTDTLIDYRGVIFHWQTGNDGNPTGLAIFHGCIQPSPCSAGLPAFTQ